MKLTKFIPFAKVDEAKREVWGIVTAEVKDKDGETCRYDPTKENYKAWSAEFQKATDGGSMGNLREMHQLKAAGKGIGMEFRDDDKEIWMGFKVVDDAAWQKVVEKVYTGFSQGGEYVDGPDADGYYTAKPSEVSLVDNPCLGVAHFAFIRSTGAVEMVKIRSVGDVVKDAREYTARKAKLPILVKAVTEGVQKGMYEVSNFAQLLNEISWLQSSALYERDREGDDSEIPEKLLADLRALCQTFLAMAEEEAAELTVDRIGKGLNMTALQKAVSELSKAAKSTLHAHMKKALEHHEKMGAALADCMKAMGHEPDEDEDTMDAEKARKAATAAGLSGAALEKFVKEFTAEPKPETATSDAAIRKTGEAGGLTGTALDEFVRKATGKPEQLTKADIAAIVGETVAEALKAVFARPDGAKPQQTSIPVTKGQDAGGKPPETVDLSKLSPEEQALAILKATPGEHLTADEAMRRGVIR